MKFIEFRDLERLSNKPKAFLEEFQKRTQNLNSEDSLQLLRLSGITVDLYSTGKNVKLFGQCIMYLHEKFKDEAACGIIQIIKEAAIFDELFARFEVFRTDAGLTSIEDGKRKFPFLLSGQRIIDRLKKEGERFIPEGRSSIKEGDLGTFYEGWISELARGNLDKRVYIYEAVVSDLSLVLKFIQHRFSDDFAICLEEPLVQRSAQYFNIVHPYKSLYELHERWRFFGLQIHRNIEKNHIIFNDPTIAIFEMAIDASRYVDQIRVNQMSNATALYGKIFNERTTVLPPIDFLMMEEVIAAENFANRMHVDDIYSLQFFGVSVAEWVRSYSVIMQISQNSADGSGGRGFLRVSKADLQRRLIIRGVKPNSTNTIITQLTFDAKKSVDLFDSPLLVTTSGEFILFHCVCGSLNFGESFLSNLQSAGADLSNRGFSFEDRLTDEFRLVGLRAGKVHSKIGNDEYECDIAVLVDQDLYLIEAKVFFEPRSIRKKYEHTEKIEDAVNQLRRIADYYSVNQKIVFDKLGISPHPVIANVIRVVVTSTTYSGASKIGDTYIVDFSSLSRFISRQPLAIVSHQKTDQDSLRRTAHNFPQYEELYSGKLSSEKFQEFLTLQPPVELTKAKFEIDVVPQPIGDLLLLYQVPIQKVPTAMGVVSEASAE